MRRWTELLMALTIAAAVAACEGANKRGTDDKAAAPAAGQASPGSGAAGTAGREAARNDDEAREFITSMAAAGVAEVELGRLAQEKAASAEVKQFAEMMVRDHTTANNELKQIAERLNVAVPTAMDDEHRELYERLSRLSGREFDREYIKAMVDGHKDVVDKLERQANDGSNPQLKQFAATTLPTVRQHLERAQQIQQMLEQREGRN